MARSKLIQPAPLILGMLSAPTRWDRISICSVALSLFAVHYTIPKEPTTSAKSGTALCGHQSNISSGDASCSCHLLPWSSHQGEWHHSDWFRDGWHGQCPQVWPCDLSAVSGGANLGRIHVNRDILALWMWLMGKVSKATALLTWPSNDFVLGKYHKLGIALNQGKGVHLTTAEERGRVAAKQSSGWSDL